MELGRRFKKRLHLALSLFRVRRLVAQLEPSGDGGASHFDALPGAFKTWRQALRTGDPEAGLDALETVWALIAASREDVREHDRGIEAFRVRWACENAPLRNQTIDALARFYRTIPFSSGSQSKYEYVLTRRMAGPLRPARSLPPTAELIEAVVALESMWGAPSVQVEESDRETLTRSLAIFVQEAWSKGDAASFTASGLLRRFGAFKASMGERLFDPRISVAVVEANVAVLNAWSQLLADVGGQPLRAAGARRLSGPIPRLSLSAEALPPPSAEPGGEAPPSVSRADVEAVAAARRADLRTGEIDTPGLDSTQSRLEVEAPPPPPPAESPSAEPSAPTPPAPAPEAAKGPDGTRPDLSTGEVDISGLEFVRRHRRSASDAGPEPEFAAPATQLDVETPPHSGTETASQAAAPTEQQPSARAFELAALPHNAEIIRHYLRRPRSAEVFQLDLDVFLASSDASSDTPPADAERQSADRRRAFQLILASDDLICLRATQEGPPSAEYKADVRRVANAMLMLRTSLRREASPGDGRETELLLYVSDHLLWERLRLEASLKRNPRRQKPKPLPRRTTADLAALQATQVRRRQRRTLLQVVGVAAVLTFAIGGLSAVVPTTPVDPEVLSVDVTSFPGTQLYSEAQGLKTTLFVTATDSWLLLGQEQRRSFVQSLAAYAGERGFDTVSILGPLGEPWASFAADEVTLYDEPVDLLGPRR